MHDQDIYIIGAGAIGKTLAVALRLENRNVHLLRGSVKDGGTTAQTIAVIQESGEKTEAVVDVSTFGRFPELNGIIVLTNKSYGNRQLAEALRHKAGHSPVVLLQNGWEVEQPFIDLHYPTVYRCVLFVTAQTVGEHAVRFKPVSVSPIGIVRGTVAGLEKVVSLLDTPRFQFRAEDDIETVVWRKAVINCVFNSICPLLDVDNGIFHRHEAALTIARRVIAECVAVAGAKGIRLDAGEVEQNLLRISRSSDGQLISTLQDIKHGRETEIDTLNLAIARMAEGLGMREAVRETALLGELTKIRSQLRI